MRVYDTGSTVTPLTSTQKQSISPVLDYSYAIDKSCVNLKYVPVSFDFNIRLDYAIDSEVYYIRESNKSYYLRESVKTVYLPPNPVEGDVVTLVNAFRWDEIRIFTVCKDMYVNDKFYGFLEFVYCGEGWDIRRKGSYFIKMPTDVLNYVKVIHTSLTSNQYATDIHSTGYVSYSDVYEIYSINDPPENQVPARYSNNKISFTASGVVSGPINSVTYSQVDSALYNNFKCWEIRANATLITANILERLRFVYESTRLFDLPVEHLSALLRDSKLKFINSSISTQDPIYTLPDGAVLTRVYNETQKAELFELVDYVVNPEGEVVPTRLGRIYHLDTIILEFTSNFVG